MDASRQLIMAILIAGLGADDYRVREHCHRHLVNAGSLAIAHLEVAAKSKDVERSRRASKIICSWRQANKGRMAAAFLPRWHAQMPWIVGGMEEFDGLRYLRMARDNGFVIDPPDWPDYREAMRLAVADMWADGVSDERIRAIVNQCRLEEKQWLCMGYVTAKRPHDLPD